MSDDLEELTFTRLKIPRLIPKSLIENVKGRTFTPEQFYECQEYQVDNPNNHLYVLIDKEKKIQGYLWAEVSKMDSSLFINTFSIDKRYWFKGRAIEKAAEIIRYIQEKVKPPVIIMCTTNAKVFFKYGFKSSKISLIEYNPVQQKAG